MKTQKTAGTSLEIALSKICGKDDIITPILKEDEAYRKEYANISAQNYTIPLSKYSALDVLKSIAKRKPKAFYNHIPCAEIKENVSQDIWESYYKFTVDRNPFDKVVSLYFWQGGDKKFKSVYDFLTQGGLREFQSYDFYSINGVQAVDQVYKYEEMDKMCLDLTKKLELSEPLQLPPYKAKSKVRKVKNYRDILDEKSIALIKVIFAREIKLFGYEY